MAAWSVSSRSWATKLFRSPTQVHCRPSGTLKVYKDLPHGMPTTHADIIKADLLAFFKA